MTDSKTGLEGHVPQAEETLEVPLTDFLFFLSYFGTHLDNPALARVLDRFGLAERETLTEVEMAVVVDALAVEAREGLAALDGPAAGAYARLADLTSGVVNMVALPD